MPKETNRTIRIKQAIVTLMKERSDWDSRRLRKSCLDAIGGGDAKERARLGNSIRRILTQLLELGALASGEGDGITVGPAFETLAGELAAMPSDPENTLSESEKLQTAPAKDKETKKPKERDMRLFLSELLSSGALAEGEIVKAAVQRFEVKGERVHGVRGLTLQVLKLLVTEGAVVCTNGVYARPAAEAAAKSQDEKREPARRTTAVKVQRATKVKTRQVTLAPTPDAVLDEKGLAQLINSKGGDFFNVFVAKLLEKYYAAIGVRIVGRFVVDGSEDRGIDVVFHICDELGFCDKVAVQAKTRARSQITLKELREFYGSVHAEGATKGIFVTTATFTTEAVEFLRKNENLAGIDAVKLHELACRYEIGVRHRDGKPYAASELLSR